ncbi:MAG: hypothetical protein JXC36_08990 [Candidatus Atribacteria bacterium]|nr:hypothetical protein [Candidatus Atribacteria bacterium]
MFDGLIQGILVFLSLVLSLYFQLFRKLPKNKLAYGIIFGFISVFFAFFIGYLTYYSAQQKSIKSIQFNLLYGNKIEFPNRIEDWNREFYVPFRCQFNVETEDLTIYRINRNGEKENICNKIYEKTKKNQERRIDLTHSNSLVLRGGSIDLNIPVTASHVIEGWFKIRIEKMGIDKKVINTDRDFEVLAPIDGTSEAWKHTAQVEYSSLPVGNTVTLNIYIENQGMESEFSSVLEIIDFETDKRIGEKYYELEPARNVQRINKGDKRRFSEWKIKFLQKGKYILDTSIKKDIPYFRYAENDSWKDSYNHQKLIVEAFYSNLITESSMSISDTLINTSQLESSIDNFDHAIYKLRKGEATLYAKPDVFSKSVIDGTLFRNTRVLVYGKGKTAQEIIRNSRDFVKVKVISLGKDGYILKDYF